MLDGRLDHALNRVPIRHICSAAHSDTAARPDLGHDACKLPVRSCGNADFTSGSGYCVRDRPPNTSAATGNYCDLAPQRISAVLHVVLPACDAYHNQPLY